MTCKTKNLIYCIECSNCKDIYIGQTKNSLSERNRVHRQQIRQPEYRNCPVSGHLDRCSGGRYKIFPFYKMSTKSTCNIQREIKERFFIRKFNSPLNPR